MGLDTYELPVPSLPPAVIINDPRVLEFVLKDAELFVKGDFFRSRSWDLFGETLFLGAFTFSPLLTGLCSKRHPQ